MVTYYTLGSDPRNDEEGNEGSFTVVVVLTGLRYVLLLFVYIIYWNCWVSFLRHYSYC